jgi:adenylate kinase
MTDSRLVRLFGLDYEGNVVKAGRFHGGGRHMRLVLFGPPGSGKGTQARLLQERLGLRYIATGDALREAIRQQTPTGKAAKPYIDDGRLVPDDLVNQLVTDIFLCDSRPRCFVLDGYPRTLQQARAFDELLKDLGLNLNAVLQFVIPDDEVVRRLGGGGRWTCSNPKCGATFNLTNRAPKRSGFCDRCGWPLMQREDDEEETIRRRLQIYHDNTSGVLAHYRAAKLLHEVPTDAPVESVYQNIIKLLKPHEGEAPCSGPTSSKPRN